MSSHNQNYRIRVGLFILISILLFLAAIFILGRQRNMFNPVAILSTNFINVSGLQVGNNVRFLGINVGNVDGITIINDSTVQVDMLLKAEVLPFINKSSKVSISSEGIIGDRILTISKGIGDSSKIHSGQVLKSLEPIEMDEIMASLQVTALNAEIITEELSEIMVNINTGNGTLGKLIKDEGIADDLTQTILNLKRSSKGLDENMEAAKSNFLLRGYYNKKAKAEEDRKKAVSEKAEEVRKKAVSEKAKKDAKKVKNKK